MAAGITCQQVSTPTTLTAPKANDTHGKLRLIPLVPQVYPVVFTQPIRRLYYLLRHTFTHISTDPINTKKRKV
jgi:hypothetical protein